MGVYKYPPLRECKVGGNKFNEIVHLVSLESRFVHFSCLISLERQPVFEGLGIEQHWHPPWLLLELIMAPKKLNLPTDKAGPSAATAIVAAAKTATQNDATTAMEPPVP